MKLTNQMNCHSRKLLSGIPTLDKICGKDPRLQASGMTTLLNNTPSSVLTGHLPPHGEAANLNAPSTWRDRVACVSTGVRGKIAHGFTLIELLVVVLVIGILAAVGLPQYQKVIFESQMSEVITSARQLAKQIELYYMEYGTYPQHWKELALTWSNCTETKDSLAYLICPHFYADLNDANFIIYKTPNGVSSFSPLFIRYDFIHTEATAAGRFLCNSSGQGNDLGAYYCKKLCTEKDCRFR